MSCGTGGQGLQTADTHSVSHSQGFGEGLLASVAVSHGGARELKPSVSTHHTAWLAPAMRTVKLVGSGIG